MTYSDVILADSPLAYWRLGEASGTTMTDTSGNGHTGTYSGTFTLGATGLISGSDTALSVSGSGLSTVTNSSWMDVTTSMSVEAWIKPTSVTGTQVIVSRNLNEGGSSNSQWGLRLNANKIEAMVCTSGGISVLTSAGTISTGTTYHVAMTYDGSYIRLFINGVQDNISSKTGSITTGQPITVASRGDGSNKFNGTLDEIAFYGTSLSSTSIQGHYTSGLSATASAGRTNWSKLNILKMLLGKSYTQLTFPLTVKLITTVCNADIQGVECAGNEYEEQPINWDLTSGTTSVKNIESIHFPTLDSDSSIDVYGYEVWDSSVIENRIFFQTFASPVTIGADVASTFDPQALIISVDDANDLLSDSAEALILTWMTGGSVTPPFTVPLQIRLMTANGSESTNGTECTGNLYSRQNVYWNDPVISGSGNSAYATATNSAVVTFSSLSSTASTSITGIEIWDTSGSPKRLAYQNYGSPISVPANTVADFAVGAIEFRVM